MEKIQQVQKVMLLRINTVRKWFATTALRFHDLRHTNATLMLKQNISPKVASERLGHSSIGITMDTYSHVLKELQQDAANRLNMVFCKKNDK